MYACLECGYVNIINKTKRKRVDIDRKQQRQWPAYSFHGHITYRICPKCDNHVELKREED